MQRTSTSGTYYLEHIDALESMHQMRHRVLNVHIIVIYAHEDTAF